MGMAKRAEAQDDLPPLVDDAVIEGLRGALGPATEGLIAKATELLRDRIARLPGRAVSQAEEGARIAHEIGGMAGQIGLARLARVALGIEQGLRSGDATRMDAARTAAEGLAALAEGSLAALCRG